MTFEIHVTTFAKFAAHLKTQGYIRHLQQTGHPDIAEHIYDGILTTDEAQRLIKGEQLWQRSYQMARAQQKGKFPLYRGA
jgi:hypothetical protein